MKSGKTAFETCSRPDVVVQLDRIYRKLIGYALGREDRTMIADVEVLRCITEELEEKIYEIEKRFKDV